MVFGESAESEVLCEGFVALDEGGVREFVRGG